MLQIVGDIIVLWRAQALWQGPSYIMILPYILFLGMCGIALAQAGVLVDYTVVALVLDPQFPSHVTQVLATTASALSLVFNASCVCLVVYILWSHRLLLHPVVISRSRAQKILSLLIESGTVYCGLQIINIIFTSLHPNLDTSLYVFMPIPIEFYTMVTGMYPMFVWLLVHQNHSVVESYSFVVGPSLRPEVDPA